MKMIRKTFTLTTLVLALFCLIGCNGESETLTFQKKGSPRTDLVGKYPSGNALTINALLTNQYRYINERVHEIDYLSEIAERKEVEWFHQHFDYLFEEQNELNSWVLEQIDAENILVFGTSSEDIHIATLAFTPDLIVPELFQEKNGIILDSNTADHCLEWCPWGYAYGGSASCNCWMSLCCGFGEIFCHIPCPHENEMITLEEVLAPKHWIKEYTKLSEVPVYEVEVGQPVLPY